jgi:hypothetical protein
VAPLTNVAPFVAAFQITDLGEQISIAAREKDQKWTGCGHRLRFSRVDHDPMPMRIPYVQAREKSQGFRGFRQETLRFPILLKLE